MSDGEPLVLAARQAGRQRSREAPVGPGGRGHLRPALTMLARLLLLMWFVATLSFLLATLSPIDPVNAYVGADLSRVGPEQRQRIAERWGLDRPAPERYLRWLGQVARGDFGTSMIYNRPVLTVIGERFVASLALMAAAWTMTGLLGFALGVAAGASPWRRLDRLLRWYAYLLSSIPAFWAGMLLLFVFAVWLKVAPVCCAAPPGMPAAEVTLLDRLRHLALPAATLAILGIANLTLHTRQKLRDALDSEYARFALARGESRWGVVRHHGLHNAAIPAVTLQFAHFGELFGGAVLAETVFTYPGLGRAAVQAGLRGDVPLLLGIAVFTSVFVFAGNRAADLISRRVDPRWRLGE